jgi:Reverse transcriptase (RNA-dependent DNA polymerase)
MAVNMQIPNDIIQIIRNMYVNNQGVVSINGQDQKNFTANTGVRQGDGASPKLFNIFFD